MTTQSDGRPLAQPESIQSFGFLLAVDSQWIISRASSNLESHLGQTPASVIGHHLTALMPADTLHAIRNRMAFLTFTKGIERLYRVDCTPGFGQFDIAIHHSDSFLIIEGEPWLGEERTDATSLVRAVMSRLGAITGLEKFCQDAARQMRAMTGFARVMVYRFADDGSGSVIAESLAAHEKSFLGLHFPASDLPDEARAVYLRNPFRIIADVAAPTAPLWPDATEDSKPLDLTLSMLRAESKAHLTDLENLGVGASLSVSIVVDGELWGLFTCHHPVAKRPNFTIRTAAELFGQLFSLTLESWFRKTYNEADEHTRAHVDSMTVAIAADSRLLTDAAWLQASIAQIVACDGVVTVTRNSMSSSGSVPSAHQVLAIIQQIQGIQPGGIFSTNCLTKLLAEAGGYAETSAGVLAIPISQNRKDYILLFRRQRTDPLAWDRVHDVPTGPYSNLSAGRREKLEALLRDMQGCSLPFTHQEKRAAERVRSSWIEVILQVASNEAEERRKAIERQELLIAELNHRVRNILALIRGLVSQTTGNSEDLAVTTYVESLSARIQSIARAHDQITRRNWGPSSLADLIEVELDTFATHHGPRFSYVGPDVHLYPTAFSSLSLVIHELATNSAKYGALKSPGGSVTISICREDTKGLTIVWKEQGGQAVLAPTSRGFGSLIIERMVPFDLQGTATLSYEQSGVEAAFFIPEHHIHATAGKSTEPTSASPRVSSPKTAARHSATMLADHTVLLLEDNLIVALEAEDLLRSFGANVVRVFGSIGEARRSASVSTYTFAVLDINVGTENSLELAGELCATKTRLVFASGYGEDTDFGEFHRSHTTVSKPYTRDTLGNGIARALQS